MKKQDRIRRGNDLGGKCNAGFKQDQQNFMWVYKPSESLWEGNSNERTEKQVSLTKLLPQALKAPQVPLHPRKEQDLEEAGGRSRLLCVFRMTV